MADNSPPPGWDDAPVVKPEGWDSAPVVKTSTDVDVPSRGKEATDYAGPVKEASGLVSVKPMQGQEPGLRALADAARHPIDTATNPAKRRELERGVSDSVTFGLAQKLGEKVDPAFAATAKPDATAAPGYREGGAIAGMAMPSAVANGMGRAATAVAGGTIKGAARIAQPVGSQQLGFGIGEASAAGGGKLSNAAQKFADATKGIRHAATGGGIAGMAFGHGHAGAVPVAIDAAVSAAPTVIRQAEKIATTMGALTAKPATKEIAKYAEKLATLGLRAHQINLAVDRANKDLDNAAQ